VDGVRPVEAYASRQPALVTVEIVEAFHSSMLTVPKRGCNCQYGANGLTN
jgi:hypothetical protein